MPLLSEGLSMFLKIKQVGITTVLALAVSYTNVVLAKTQYHRLSWDVDPAHNAIIGFSPNGQSQAPEVRYGFSTDESLWSSQTVSSEAVFDGKLTSYFVRLSGLPENSPVYYRVCDQEGCGDKLWFKTAPTDESPFTLVAGGDTRSGHTNRRKGNQLIAKIRPLAILHGGDFTNKNTAAQIELFLQDWQLTLSADIIGGQDFKRIYPLLPTHGNHEDGNYKTLCQVFGVDFDQDEQCTFNDTYNSVSISPLLRAYTLNSQFMNAGWSSYANTMNQWLTDDLARHQGENVWRIAQYHKPMFPHYSGKAENLQLHTWWADIFYQQAMNLVVESDTHINKMTEALKPTSNNFVATEEGGTVFIGEGSWGAPARSANAPKEWTIDLAAIQQFKVLSVSKDNISVRTAQFDGDVKAVTRIARESDPLILPEQVNWWHAQGLGEVMQLAQSSDGKTVIDRSGYQVPDVLEISDDTSIASSKADRNFNNHKRGIFSNAENTNLGETRGLLKFDLSAVPECKLFSSAKLKINITDHSKSSYDVYLANKTWQEGDATWNSVGGDAHNGALLGTFKPTTRGFMKIDLQNLDQLNTWLLGENTGLIIVSSGGSDAIRFEDKEQGQGAQLLVQYRDNDSCFITEEFHVDVTQDTFVSSKIASGNFDNHQDGLLADNSDVQFGKIASLLQFSLTDYPQCHRPVSAQLTLQVTNPSKGKYEVYQQLMPWLESTATWQNTEANNREQLITTFSPHSIGQVHLKISPDVISQWLKGENNGLIIASGGTGDGVDFESKEIGQAAQLIIGYQEVDDCATYNADLDNDEDVDRNDIIKFSQGLAAGRALPMSLDFNNDNTVNRSDMRAMLKLCTRTRCATE